MRTPKTALTVIVAFTLTAGAAGEAFKLYPGATQYTPPETEETREFTSALRPGTTITAYLTKDSFDKVVAFYRGLGKQYSNPKMKAGEKLPNGQRVKKTFVIFDGASDLLHSRQWISIQRPFIGSVSRKDGVPEYSDVRDVTEIVLTEKAAAPKKTP